MANINNFQICIADQRTPLVVFFGGTSCGKLMTIVRLSRYLEQYGCQISPDFCLRPDSDEIYQRVCKQFNEEIYSEKNILRWPCPRTILVKIINRGIAKCQLLKLPGEHCINPDYNYECLPVYFNYIVNVPNKKVWVFFLDGHKGDERLDYCTSQMLRLLKLINPKDRIVFLYSKVDQYIHYTDSSPEDLFREFRNKYPQLIDFVKHKFKKRSFFSPNKFDFVLFSAGNFYQSNNIDRFCPGSDDYPQQLWKVIMKSTH